MTTTDSQNFKEIQEIDVHHVVTLEVDFPFTSRSSLDMQDATHTMMISGIAIKCQLKGLSLRYQYDPLRNSFKKFYDRYQDLIVKYQRSVSDIVRDFCQLLENSQCILDNLQENSEHGNLCKIL